MCVYATILLGLQTKLWLLKLITRLWQEAARATVGITIIDWLQRGSGSGREREREREREIGRV